MFLSYTKYDVINRIFKFIFIHSAYKFVQYSKLYYLRPFFPRIVALSFYLSFLYINVAPYTVRRTHEKLSNCDLRCKLVDSYPVPLRFEYRGTVFLGPPNTQLVNFVQPALHYALDK